MRELLILFGALIGWVLGYVFRLYTPGKGKEEGSDRQQELTEAEKTIRHLEAQLDQYQHLQEQLTACEIQLQQKIEDLEVMNAKCNSAEAQVKTLQQHITSLEQKMQADAAASPEIEEEIPQAVELERPSEERSQAVEAETPSEEISEAVEPEPPSEEIPQAIETELPSDETLSEAESEKEPETARSAAEEPDNLRKIEGIGPKVAQLLNESGILTFGQLAQIEVERLRAILEEAGPPFKGMDPASWPEQADLAAKEDWEALKTLQDQLDGGRYKS